MAVLPSPKTQELAVVRPSIKAASCTVKPINTLVYDAAMPTRNGPDTAPAWYSSHPIEGGLAQASPSMSVPLA